jgi:hypothetical protein
VPQRALRILLHRLPLAALIAVASCRASPDHLSYDDDGVAQEVLALVPYNTKWARRIAYDAVLYRIELRTGAPGDSVPSEALYTYYSAGTRSFLTATSDPGTPWAGAEPMAWPVRRSAPLPLPSVKIDFKEAWRLASATGIYRVTSAVLEVNRRNGIPIVAWTFTGELSDLRERGVYFDALTGERLYAHTLFDPPTSTRQVEEATSIYRGALRGDIAQDTKCPKRAIAIPARRPVVCFDVERQRYDEYKG